MTIPSLIPANPANPASPAKPAIPAEPPSSVDSRGESVAPDRVRREMQLRRLREERERLLAAEEQRKRKEEQEQRIRLEMERIRKKAEEKRRAEEEKRRIQVEEEKRRVEEITKQRREVEQRQLKERLELKREAERRRSPTPPPIVETENPEIPAEDESAPFRPQSPPKTVETGDTQGSTVSTVPPVSTAPMGSPARTGLLSSFAGFFSSRSPAKEDETPAKEDETPIKDETPVKKETPAKPLSVSQAPANPVTVSLNARALNSRGLGSPQSPAGNRKLLAEESRESLFTSIPLVNESFNPFASDSDVDSEGFPALPMFENSMEDSVANPFGRESVVLRRLDAKSEASVEDSAERTAGPVKLNPFDETPDGSPRNSMEQGVKRPSIVVNLNPTKEELKPNPQIVKLNPFDEEETPESSPRNPFDEDVKPKQGVVKLNPFDMDETPESSPRNPFDQDVKPAKKETKLNPFDVDETPESSPRNPFDEDVKPKQRVVKLNPFDETSDSLDMDVPQISPISLRESFSQLTSAAEKRTQPAPTNPFGTQTQTQTQTQSNSNSKETTETQTNTNQNKAEYESNEEEEEEEFTDDPEYANERRDLRSMFEVYQSNKNGRNEPRR